LPERQKNVTNQVTVCIDSAYGLRIVGSVLFNVLWEKGVNSEARAVLILKEQYREKASEIEVREPEHIDADENETTNVRGKGTEGREGEKKEKRRARDECDWRGGGEERRRKEGRITSAKGKETEKGEGESIEKSSALDELHWAIDSIEDYNLRGLKDRHKNTELIGKLL